MHLAHLTHNNLLEEPLESLIRNHHHTYPLMVVQNSRILSGLAVDPTFMHDTTLLVEYISAINRSRHTTTNLE